MRPGFDDAAFVQRHDQVRVAHGRQTVRDYDGRPIGHEFFKCRADSLLIHSVQMRCGFVENQYRCVLQESAGDRNPLTLAAREAHAPLTDFGVQPVRQSGDEFAERGTLHGRHQRRFVHIRIGNQNVGAKRVVKEIGVLCNKRELTPQVVERIVA